MRTFSSASHLAPTQERHTCRVSIFLKVAIGLLLTLPLGAYIAGTLVASQASMPDERAPIVVESTPSSSTTTATPSRTPRPSPSRTTPTPDDRRSDDGRHDDSDDSGHDDDSDDVKVVRPSPREVEDDREDDAEDAREDAEDDAEDAREEDAKDVEDDARDSDDGSGDD